MPLELLLCCGLGPAVPKTWVRVPQDNIGDNYYCVGETTSIIYNSGQHRISEHTYTNIGYHNYAILGIYHHLSINPLGSQWALRDGDMAMDLPPLDTPWPRTNVWAWVGMPRGLFPYVSMFFFCRIWRNLCHLWLQCATSYTQMNYVSTADILRLKTGYWWPWGFDSLKDLSRWRLLGLCWHSQVHHLIQLFQLLGGTTTVLRCCANRMCRWRHGSLDSGEQDISIHATSSH